MKHATDAGTAHTGTAHVGKGPYGRLVIMTVLSFIAMYVFMYAMVDSIGNAYPNLNQLYMTGLMAASMVLIEIGVMRGMYPDRKRNVLIAAGGVAVLIVCFVFIRRQTAISDRQFLRSMIPHHASAILMCEHASIRDADVRRLCQDIISGQEEQIGQMKAKLRALR